MYRRMKERREENESDKRSNKWVTERMEETSDPSFLEWRNTQTYEPMGKWMNGQIGKYMDEMVNERDEAKYMDC